MLSEALQVSAGLLAVNAGEWIVHKYILHGLGKNKDSFWAFHWREHHRSSRRHNFFDPDYVRSVFHWNSQGKEALGLIAAGLVVVPLVTAVPWFCGGIWAGLSTYYLVHKKAHLSPGWAKTWLPWHMQHHCGKNQDANWGVTSPLFDWIMGTREKPEDRR